MSSLLIKHRRTSDPALLCRLDSPRRTARILCESTYVPSIAAPLRPIALTCQIQAMSDTDDEFDQTPATSTSDDEGKLDLKDVASKAITFLKTKSPEIFERFEQVYWSMLRAVICSGGSYTRSQMPICAVVEMQIVLRNIWAGEAVAPPRAGDKPAHQNWKGFATPCATVLQATRINCFQELLAMMRGMRR